MFIFSKQKIAIFSLAIFVWLTLFPYIIWGKLYILSVIFMLSAITSFLYLLEGGIKLQNLLFGYFIAILVLLFYKLNGASWGWTILMSFSIMLLLLYTREDIKKIFYLFKLFFAISLIPGMILWLLFIIGFDINLLSLGSVADGAVLNQTKVQAGVSYIVFPGSVMLDYMLSWPIFRMQGMYDEPGVLGTIAALILVTEKMDFNKKLNLIIFIGGLTSLSLAFYLIIAIYFILNIKKNIKTVIISLSAILFIFVFLPSSVQKSIEAKTIDRMQIDSNFNVSGDNRESKDSRNWANWKDSDTKNFLLGMKVESDGSSSWKNILILSGYFGFLILLIIYFLLFFQKYRKVNYYHFVFIFIFILSFTQRPYIVTPVYILIFIYAIETLRSKELVSNNILKPKYKSV